LGFSAGQCPSVLALAGEGSLQFGDVEFFIPSIACIARWALLWSASVIMCMNATGTICHDTPNLSLSQPHCCASTGPPALRLPQKWSTSSWFWQLT